MSSSKPKKEKTDGGPKKPTLSRATLKDLTATTAEVKGGIPKRPTPPD